MAQAKGRIPFFKTDDLPSGTEVMIIDEIKEGGKFNSMQGTIQTSDGRQFIASFNATSQTNCSAKWGDDTKEWIGKTVIYTVDTRGTVPLGT